MGTKPARIGGALIRPFAAEKSERSFGQEQTKVRHRYRAVSPDPENSSHFGTARPNGGRNRHELDFQPWRRRVPTRIAKATPAAASPAITR